MQSCKKTHHLKRYVCIIILLLINILMLIVLWRVRTNGDRQKIQNNLAVTEFELKSVTLYWQNFWTKDEYYAELTGAELSEFCTLWNENWVCYLEPYDTMEKVNLPMKTGPIWDEVTFEYSDGRKKIFRVSEEYIVDFEYNKWYFHTSLLIPNYITERLGLGSEANLW